MWVRNKSVHRSCHNQFNVCFTADHTLVSDQRFRSATYVTNHMEQVKQIFMNSNSEEFASEYLENVEDIADSIS